MSYTIDKFAMLEPMKDDIWYFIGTVIYYN